MSQKQMYVTQRYDLQAPQELVRKTWNMRFSPHHPRDRWLAEQIATFDRMAHGGKSMSELVKVLLVDYFVQCMEPERTRLSLKAPRAYGLGDAAPAAASPLHRK